ncbi:glycosyltransferase family 2 protein [Candidatus Venteria ishoeyi]|uniref:glycosyltransferase family 2 protein n=1 Tax=Candidatus Venteria ishoeyi TaxID=1899563 RepID=UPI0025A5147C|nr:glycosyltransferase family 2 protein [Candidatus Venteria ishoeyi]MDM8547661.1 glycosyltransferase family 2 protein [Candidatus Venteria ishoeyi]
MWTSLKQKFPRLFAKPIVANNNKQHLKALNHWIPAVILPGRQTVATASGSHPIPLREAVCLCWQLIPLQNKVTRIHLRFGTYGRQNTCHLLLRINGKPVLRFSCAHILDNDYTEVLFPRPFFCMAGQLLNFELSTPDASPENHLALWCTPKPAVYAAGALLDREQGLCATNSTWGDTPIALLPGVFIRTRWMPEKGVIMALRLRFGTYGRINDCQISVQIGHVQIQVDGKTLEDNAWFTIELPEPLVCAPGKPVDIVVYCADANLAQQRVVALWCVRQPPAFADVDEFKAIVLPEVKKPKISVLLPLRGWNTDIYHCLRSLLSPLENSQNPAIEILLIKQANPHPGIAHLLSCLQGHVQLLEVPEQDSLIAAWQIAAEHAKGEMLLLMQPAAQWLENSFSALLETAQQYPEAALICPKLLNRNGYLYSNGGQLLQDASIFQMESCEDATHPDYNQPRRVQACEADAILLRAADWRQLGGLDSHYACASYAVQDLLMRLAKQGRHSRYCPSAELVLRQPLRQQEKDCDKDRQYFQQHWTALLNGQPQPLRLLALQQRLQLPMEYSPQVSIIIPVYNKVLYTFNCLLSLIECDPEIRKEVILIDNASSDETRLLCENLQGAFKIIHNAENKGFVEACNQGAAQAKGEYLVFLNNDTQVRPGWLAALLAGQQQDNVGITGAKLLYPDGRLQEAGGRVFKDGSAQNYGRAQDPENPEYNQDRQVDYCSGAALMISRSLWKQLGGFDTRYIPAYYEDTDLCFSARAAGYQVLYCHRAEVIHYEGVTAGTDTATGYKKWQAINQQKFRKKWAASETLLSN